MNSHLFHLNAMKPQDKAEGGTRSRVTKSNFPHLNGISFAKVELYPKGIREPHWHANADELGYCLKGEVLVSMFATGDTKATYLVSAGEAFFIPSGSLHAIENVGKDSAELIIAFSHEEPEDFAITATFGMFSNAVLGNTWGLPSKKFEELKRSTYEVYFALQKYSTVIPSDARYSTPYRFNLENASPLITNDGGNAKVARADTWPILKRQALYSLHLTGTGMREPHWHPETAEMGYVNEGRGRMSIMSPSGQVDTYEMNQGELYFIPKAYPHHIENLTDKPLHLLIFFDQIGPADIGLTASVKSFSNSVLNSVFSCRQDFFESLPTYYRDLFIVNKLNSVDSFTFP